MPGSVRSLTLPGSFSIREADVGQAWGMQPDELGVPYIVSFEIRPPASSGR